MIGHVGTKVGALVDGQLTPAEADRLWAHVHGCALCRSHVEQEGWVKTRLAGLNMGTSQPAAPNYLRSVLCQPSALSPEPEPSESSFVVRRRTMAVAVVGAGSVGAVMVGVLALAIPAQAPSVDRRGPATSLTGVSGSSRPVAPVGATSASSTSSRTTVHDGSVPRWVTIAQ
ncbi:anti-sigma factor [Nocardioides jensenii]|uniref:zf-HC2 domain-containing protein n=1 Tax=Nocardioides jensenii TaxID=1843 RepID=UPI00082DCD44|nr:zf-HC2 domain-containing protein [Nocardioides jensenii]